MVRPWEMEERTMGRNWVAEQPLPTTATRLFSADVLVSHDIHPLQRDVAAAPTEGNVMSPRL